MTERTPWPIVLALALPAVGLYILSGVFLHGGALVCAVVGTLLYQVLVPHLVWATLAGGDGADREEARRTSPVSSSPPSP